MKKILLLLTLVFLSFENVLATEQFITEEKSTSKLHKSKVRAKKRRVSVKSLCSGVTKALNAIKNNPFAENSIWDLEVLKKETELSELLQKFLDGNYASKARMLDCKNKTQDEIVDNLLKEGFQKKSLNLEGNILAKTSDRDPQESGEIYQHADGSLVRLKPYSEKRKYRPQAYLVKAATRNPNGPPTWQNEAFKISQDGYAIPKAPKAEHGMKMKPEESTGPNEDQGWVDLIMEEVHTDL